MIDSWFESSFGIPLLSCKCVGHIAFGCNFAHIYIVKPVRFGSVDLFFLAYDEVASRK
jgi:hypothetical protein